jgi:hypothetical protein
VLCVVQALQVTLYIPCCEIIVHSGLPRKLNLAIYRLKAWGYIVYMLEVQVFGTQYVFFLKSLQRYRKSFGNASKNKGGNGME